MKLADPKPTPRAWFALWRRESGTFAQLPLLARAIFVEALKLTDDDGVIDIGRRSPVDALAWALGADRSDRRALVKYVPMLLADGCLVHEGTTLRAPSFARWQPAERSRKAPELTATEPRSGHERATNEPRTGLDAVTNEPRSCRDAVTTVPRTDHETEDKNAESFSTDLHSREEERKEEKINEHSAREGAQPGLAKASPAATYEAAVKAARARLVRGYRDRYERLTEDAWMGRDANAQAIDTVARYCAHDPERAVQRADTVLDGIFSDPWLGGVDERGKHRRWPWGPVAKDPAKYAGGAAPTVAHAARTPRQSELASLDAAIEQAIQDGDLDRVDELRAKVRAMRGAA